MNSTEEQAHHRTRYLIHVLFKHKVKALTVFLTIVASVTVWSVFIPRTYEARAKIIVAFMPRNVDTPSTSGSQNESSQAAVDALKDQGINSEVERLKGGALIAKVIGDVRVEKIYPAIHKKHKNDTWVSVINRVVPLFQQELTVKAARKSNVITISFRHNDPIIASRAVNTLVDRFVEYHTPMEQVQPDTFPDTRMTIQGMESTPPAAPDSVNAGPLREQEKLLLTQISEIEKNLTQTRDGINRHVNILRTIKAYQPGRDVPIEFDEKTVSKPQAIDSLRTQLMQLKAKEQELLKKYTERNSQVVSVREEIGEAQRLLAKEEKTYLNHVLLSINATLKTLEAKAEGLKTDMAGHQKELAQINITTEKLREKERSRILEVEKARATENRRVVSVSIAEQAIPPAKPIKPKVLLNIGVALVFGVIVRP